MGRRSRQLNRLEPANGINSFHFICERMSIRWVPRVAKNAAWISIIWYKMIKCRKAFVLVLFSRRPSTACLPCKFSCTNFSSQSLSPVAKINLFDNNFGRSVHCGLHHRIIRKARQQRPSNEIEIEN